MRSPAMPKKGEIRVPRNCSDPKIASASTEPVETSTNQPRITPSISKAHDASRSDGHWKQKLRIRNGASAGTRSITVTVLWVSSAGAVVAPCAGATRQGAPVERNELLLMPARRQNRGSYDVN